MNFKYEKLKNTTRKKSSTSCRNSILKIILWNISNIYNLGEKIFLFLNLCIVLHKKYLAQFFITNLQKKYL